MGDEATVGERMRADWNQRAREDAYYYVAFGRKSQPKDEFLSSGRDLASEVELEFPRLSKPASTLRVLEIGCGPGGLMRQIAPGVGEIHGVDVSDEMIRLANEHLVDFPNAHVHVGDGMSLKMFGDSFFDVVYSYLVFQHIPDKNVVLSYLRETYRVLKSDGVFRGQFKGNAHMGAADTWNGVAFTSEEIREFCRLERFQLLALDGIDTHYLRATWRKSGLDIDNDPIVRNPVAILGLATSKGANPVVAADGPDSWFSIWIDNLPRACGMERLSVQVGEAFGQGLYLGVFEHDTIRQMNVLLPVGMPLGFAKVQLLVDGQPVGASMEINVVPAEPQRAQVRYITDGINLVAGPRISTRSVKVVLDRVINPDTISVAVSGQPSLRFNINCLDRRRGSYELNFCLSESIPPGSHRVEVRCGSDLLDPIDIDVEQ